MTLCECWSSGSCVRRLWACALGSLVEHESCGGCVAERQGCRLHAVGMSAARNPSSESRALSIIEIIKAGSS